MIYIKKLLYNILIKLLTYVDPTVATTISGNCNFSGGFSAPIFKYANYTVWSSKKISSGDTYGGSVNVAISGYTPVAIARTTTGSSVLNVYKRFISGNTAYVYARSVGSDSTSTMTVSIIYVNNNLYKGWI